VKTENDFTHFKRDIILQRAIERDLEIVGEAVKKILALNPETHITSAKNIIGLRNIIAHAYDAVEPEMLWAIIQKNIPVLAKDLESMKKG